jgi:hypothetical protein
MYRDQIAVQSYSIKTDNSSFEMGGRDQEFGINLNKSKFYSWTNKEQIEVRECLLLFGAEYFVF